MRGKRSVGKLLAGILAIVVLMTSMPSVAYATEERSGTEVVNDLEKDISEETGQEQAKEITEEESDEESEQPDESDNSSEANGEQSGEEADQEISENDNPETGENPDVESAEGEIEEEENLETEAVEGENSDQNMIEKTVSENSVEKIENVPHTDLQSTLSVQGKNSIGRMLAEALSDKAEEQLENNGYNVFSVEMNGQTAKVTFETLKDAVLTVAIYDEAGNHLLASGSCRVYKEEKVTEVEIAEAIPQYFQVRSFLTDQETLQPLCPLYDSPMYTREMQEFLSKTTEDFDEERVLNLDEDKTNNFAVYNEDTIIVPEKEGVNILVSADEENNIYVIENADDSITALQVGDIFVYEYSEDNLLIVKIALIELEGTMATITGEKLSMEEVFDFVKIDAEADLQEARIDASELEDGVSYEGIVPYADEDIESYAIDGEAKGSVATSFKFAEKKLGDGVKLSGSLDFKLEASVKVYLAFKYQYLEVKFDYSVKLQGSLSAERTEKDAFRIPLAFIRIDIFPSVYIGMTPSFVLEAEGKATWSGTLKGTVGVAVTSDEGVRNLTSAPKFESEVKSEISVFLGISFEPEIGIVSDKIAVVSLEATSGVEVKATLSYKEPSTTKVHVCTDCIDGDIVGKIETVFKAKLFDSDKLTYKAETKKNFILRIFIIRWILMNLVWGNVLIICIKWR